MARFYHVAAFVGAMTFAGLAAFTLVQPGSASEKEKVPQFQIDTSWPKPLPHNWIFGQIGGIFVDPKDDTIWITDIATLPVRVRRWRRFLPVRGGIGLIAELLQLRQRQLPVQKIVLHQEDGAGARRQCLVH